MLNDVEMKKKKSFFRFCYKSVGSVRLPWTNLANIIFTVLSTEQRQQAATGDKLCTIWFLLCRCTVTSDLYSKAPPASKKEKVLLGDWGKVINFWLIVNLIVLFYADAASFELRFAARLILPWFSVHFCSELLLEESAKECRCDRHSIKNPAWQLLDIFVDFLNKFR